MGRKGQVSSQESRERDLVRQSEAKNKKYEEELLLKLRKARKKEKEREKKQKQKEKEKEKEKKKEEEKQKQQEKQKEKEKEKEKRKEKLNLAGTADQQPRRPVPEAQRPPQASLLERMLASALIENEEERMLDKREEQRMLSPLPAAAATTTPTPTRGVASISQILVMLAESLSNAAGPGEPVLSTAGPASHLQILGKLAESINQIVLAEEPPLTQESMSAPAAPAPTTGPASHQQILRKLAESISQIVPPEEPLLRGDSVSDPTKEIIPPSVSARPTAVSSEELQERELVRQSRIEALQYELELVRKDSLKKRIMCPPLQHHPNPGPPPVRQSQLASPEHKQEPAVKRKLIKGHARPLLHFPLHPKASAVVASTVQSAPPEPLAHKQNDTVIADDAVIAFVEEMDRAYQYFTLQDYLRAQDGITHDSDPDDITCKLTKMFRSRETNNFSLLDMNEIWRSVKHYVLELRQKYWELSGASSQNTHSCANRNPVFSLVFQTLQKRYALDENPREELKKLQTRAPLFYHDSLVCRKPTLEPDARTVIVSNVSNEASEKDMWDLFCTSGDIEYLECQRTEAGQIACITFKCMHGATHAQSYTGREVPQFLCSKGSCLVVEAKAKHVEDGSNVQAVVKKAVDVESMLARAVDRYRELWWGFQSKDDKANEKKPLDASYMDGKCGEANDWMRLEALANTFEAEGMTHVVTLGNMGCGGVFTTVRDTTTI